MTIIVYTIYGSFCNVLNAFLKSVADGLVGILFFFVFGDFFGDGFEGNGIDSAEILSLQVHVAVLVRFAAICLYTGGITPCFGVIITWRPYSSARRSICSLPLFWKAR